MQTVLFQQNFGSKQKTAPYFKGPNKKFRDGGFGGQTATGSTGIVYDLIQNTGLRRTELPVGGPNTLLKHWWRRYGRTFGGTFFLLTL